MKKLILLFILICACLVLGSCKKNVSSPEQTNSGFQPGDIFFQTIESSDQSEAIALATNCRYTHVGILFFSNNQPMIYESVGPVKFTPLAEWARRSKNEHFAVKRYRSKSFQFDSRQKQKLYHAGKSFINKPYDFQFGWDNRKIYCSELVWKIFYNGLKIELCEPKPLKTYLIDQPKVQRKLIERYGKNVPLNEKMVAPADLYNSPELVEVFRKDQ